MAPTSPGSPPAGASRRRGPGRDHGGEAYGEARQRERDVILPDGTTHGGRTPAHGRRVALIVAKRTGHKVGLDTATRMARDTDQKPSDPRSRDPSSPVDPLNELKRILWEVTRRAVGSQQRTGDKRRYSVQDLSRADRTAIRQAGTHRPASARSSDARGCARGRRP